MSSKAYDLIIIGGGSVGVPTALDAARAGLKVLVVDALPSPGQGENKKAIGGIRATHSDGGKIAVCRASIDIFRTWDETYGTDIHWRANGYSFPAYTLETETSLKTLMNTQKSFGLDIEWLDPADYRKLNPFINMEGLRGSTYSPGDGSASPLLFIESAADEAKKRGTEFLFNEKVTGLTIEAGRITAVETSKGRYSGGQVLNCAGAYGREVARMAGLDTPVTPDAHEGAISEPVARMMGPMVVDLRKRPGSTNFYFYQASGGQVIFCLTPDPPDWGIDTRATSRFLPMIARRMIEVMPALANLKVRRTWRGHYPMTPDGFPIVGQMKELDNFYQAVGLCGQGFMLGPGLARILVRMLTGRLTEEDQMALGHFDPYRSFKEKEKLH